MVEVWRLAAWGSLLLTPPIGLAPAAQDPPPAVPPQAREVPDPFVTGTPGQVRAWARARRRQALIAFYAEGCEPCAALESSTFADPDVLAWLDQRVIAIRLQGRGEEVEQRWRVTEHPTLLFLAPAGEELGRIVGYREPRAFLEEAGAILNGEDGLARARAMLERDPKDPWAHLLLARALRNRRQDAEALGEFLSVLDATRGDPTWRSLREEEVLRELGILALGSREAGAALRERRDRASALLLAPHDEAIPQAELLLAARDLRLFNLALSDTPRTLSIWDQLRQRESTPRAIVDELYGWELSALLMQAQRYGDLLWALPDPLVVVEQKLAELRRLETLAKEDPEISFQPRAEYGRLVNEASSYYEALLGSGREQDATGLADLVLAFETDAHAFTLFLLAARRVGRADVAQAILERGLQVLAAPAEREKLRNAGENALGR